MTRRLHVHRRSELAVSFGLLGTSGAVLLLIGMLSVMTGHPVHGAVLGIFRALMLCLALIWATAFPRADTRRTN